MTLQDILNLIAQQQQGNTGGSAGVASVPNASLSSALGGSPTAGPTPPSTQSVNVGGQSILPGGALGEQGLQGILGTAGAAAAPATFGASLIPAGVFALLNALGVFSGGVPRQAKTEAVGQAASQSGDPINALVGQYINSGAQGGHVLSESGGSNFELGTERLSAMLEALTGHQAPNVTTNAGFQNNPSLNAPQLGDVGSSYQLPAGYQFLNTNNSQGLNQAYQDIVNQQGSSANSIFGGPGAGAGASAQWTKLVNELISQGVLTKYSGPLGATGATGTPTGPVAGTPSTGGGSSAIPNVMLPHPLGQNPANNVPSPYPV